MKVSVGVDTHYGVHDTLRNGIRQVQGELISKHPLQDHILNHCSNTSLKKLEMANNMFGSQMKMRMEMEQMVLNSTRMGLLRNNNLGLDILQGRDDLLDFEDFLGLDDYQSRIDIHEIMEKQLF